MNNNLEELKLDLKSEMANLEYLQDVAETYLQKAKKFQQLYNESLEHIKQKQTQIHNINNQINNL